MNALQLVLRTHVNHLGTDQEMQLFDELLGFLFELATGIVKHLVGERQRNLVHLAWAALIAHIVSEVVEEDGLDARALGILNLAAHRLDQVAPVDVFIHEAESRLAHLANISVHGT